MNCPVCEFGLGFEPWAGDDASFRFCESCGIQFGFDDADPELREIVYEGWRKLWLAANKQTISESSPTRAQVSQSVIDWARKRVKVELARKLRENWFPEARQFVMDWIGFNAVYNVERGQTERDRFMAAIEEGLTESQAETILDTSVPEVRYFLTLPPGNARLNRDDPRFRVRASQDMRVAEDHNQKPTRRLAHLISAVYQIRCNLFHGGKDPKTNRSQHLIKCAQSILAKVVDALTETIESGPNDETLLALVR